MDELQSTAETCRKPEPMSNSQIEAANEVAALDDPLLCNSDLPLSAMYYPQGFSLEITTNSHEVLAAAEESWGKFVRVFSEPPVRLRIGAMKGDLEECSKVPVYRAWLNLLSIVGDGGNFAVSDFRRGRGFGWFTQATIENRAYFRYYFLEALSWMTLEPRYLTVIHAACVKLAGKTVLLCGDSGAGKSSLSLACALRGWTFLSDDSISLIRNREDRLAVGNPYSMRFREESIELFPELKQQRITPRATGEMAIELDTASMPEIATALTGSVDYIVFLNRQTPGPSRLDAFPAEAALSWFKKIIFCSEKEVREAQVASLSQLLAVPTYELCYRDLEWAVNRLDALVREGV
jgi:HPr serine kinase-like protein